jgi:hypothetical protein
MSADEACARVANDVLQVRCQPLVLGLVDEDLEALQRLVVALEHAGLGDIREPQQPVTRGVVELRRLDEPPVEPGNDLRPGERDHRRPHLLEDVDRQPHRPILESLELVRLGDLLLEPPQGLGGHGSVEEALHVELHHLVLELVVEIAASRRTPPTPGACWRPSRKTARWPKSEYAEFFPYQ